MTESVRLWTCVRFSRSAAGSMGNLEDLAASKEQPNGADASCEPSARQKVRGRFSGSSLQPCAVKMKTVSAACPRVGSVIRWPPAGLAGATNFSCASPHTGPAVSSCSLYVSLSSGIRRSSGSTNARASCTDLSMPEQTLLGDMHVHVNGDAV